MTEFTTMEKLQMRITSYGSVLQYGEMVMVTDLGWKGWTARIYEMIDTPERDGIDAAECRLNFVETTETVFPDGGHAIEWCLSRK